MYAFIILAMGGLTSYSVLPTIDSSHKLLKISVCLYWLVVPLKVVSVVFLTLLFLDSS